MAMIRLLLAAGVLAGAANAQPAPTAPGARPPRYVDPAPYDFAAHAGWTAMFDGQSLKGWEGQMDAWRVEAGAIVSSSNGQGDAANAPVYLFWAGGALTDFEFKTEIKLEGEKANSGVQFRAQMLGKTEKPNSEWESFGYQADFDFANTQTGALIECCAGPRRGPRPRPFRAAMGTALRVVPAGNDAALAGGVIEGAIAARTELERSIKVGDWNQLHIIARGHTMLYYLNGRLMSVMSDDDPARFMAGGRLAIQLEGSGARKVSYRSLWLKTYR